MLTLAVSKGRILEETNELLQKAEIIKEPIVEDRKLIIQRPEENISFILAKPMDVPIYVQYGVADMGIVGKDVLYENGENFYELMDLGIGGCRLSLCGKEKKPLVSQCRIATKYPQFTTNYFRSLGRQVEIIKLNGSVELAPILNLSDFIVDIVSTGKTLKENGLLELEVLQKISCRLIVNPSSYHLKSDVIEDIITKLEPAVKKA